MASYHFRVKQVRRSKGQNVVAAAAYRAGERLRVEASGRFVDYRSRANADAILHSEIMAPEGSAEFLRDRQALWNTVEVMETRRDAQLAREVELALPRELAHDEHVDLVRRFVAEHFVARGMVADIAIHAPPEGSRDNHHAHILLTLRQATAEGLRRVKTREWNARELVNVWRESWADYQNLALERGGHAARVDHRTLKAQREDALKRGDRAQAATLDRAPEIHVGPKTKEALRAGRTVRTEDRVRGAKRPQPETFVRREGTGRNARLVDAASQRRVVAYSRLDQGTRLDRNAELTRFNREKARAFAERRERQAARFRRAEMLYTRKIGEIDRRLAGLGAGKGGVLGMLFGGKSTASERTILEARRAHYQRRSALAHSLLRDIEHILSRLFSAHRSRVDRHRTVSRDWVTELGLSNDRKSGRARGLLG